MGHKTHPYGFRLGIIKDWKAHWYAPNSSSYRALVTQDLRLRDSIKNEYKAFSDAGIAKVEIDRGAQDSVINIHSARPGILIGRDGERVKNLRGKLEAITHPPIRLELTRQIEQLRREGSVKGKSVVFKDPNGPRPTFRRPYY